MDTQSNMPTPPPYATMEGDLISVSTAVSGLIDLTGSIAIAVEGLNNDLMGASPIGTTIGAESKNLKATLRLLQRCLDNRHQTPHRAGMIAMESLVVVLMDMVLLGDDLCLLVQKMTEEGNTIAESKNKLFQRHAPELGPYTKRIHNDTLVLTALNAILLSKSDKEAVFSSNYVKLATQKLMSTNTALSQKMSRMDGLFANADDFTSILTSDAQTVRARMAESIAESTNTRTTTASEAQYGGAGPATLGNFASESTDRLLLDDSASNFSFDNELNQSTVYQRYGRELSSVDLPEYQSTLGTGMTLGDGVQLCNVPMPITTSEIREPSFYSKETLRASESPSGRKGWKKILGRSKESAGLLDSVPEQQQQPVPVEIVRTKPDTWGMVAKRQPFSSRNGAARIA